MLPDRSSVVSSDRSISAVTVSNTTSSGSASSGQTASTASMVHPPAKTATRRKHTCSVSLSRSWLHSMAASRVLCRGRLARLPPVSSRNLLPSRAASCATVSALTRAAASSMASGMPSSCRQISPTAATFPAVRPNPGRASAARSQNSRTDSASPAARGSAISGSGTVSGGTGQLASPGTPSLVWLVARIRSRGQLRRSAAIVSAAASMTCSQLSTMSRASMSRSRATMLSRRVWPGSSLADTARPMVGTTRSGWPIGASWTSHTPPS